MRAEEIREIRTSIDGMGKHVINLAIAAMVGMASMTVAIIISIFIQNRREKYESPLAFFELWKTITLKKCN